MTDHRCLTRARDGAPRSAANVRQAARAAILAAVTSALAYVRVPLPGLAVPLTGQTLGVMLAGTLLDPAAAFLSQAIYLALGAAGLPVFSGGAAGPAVLAGPTGGFLLGFPFGALVIASLRRKGSSRGYRLASVWIWTATIAGGVVLIHATGLAHLRVFAGVPLARGFLTASLPFLPGDLVKAGIAVLVGRRLNSALR